MAIKDTAVTLDLDKQNFPLLPLRDVVVFPHTVIPLFVGRKQSVDAVTEAMATTKHIFLVAQKNENNEQPEQKDIYGTGTLAAILQMLKLSDGTIKVLVEGILRAKISEYQTGDKFSSVVINAIKTTEELQEKT